MSDQTAKLIKAIRREAERRKHAEEARRTASAKLQVLFSDARAAGIPITQIAREANLSRQAVYDLLGAKPTLPRPRSAGSHPSARRPS